MNDIKALLKENKQQLALFGVVIAALFVILMGIFVWKLPVVAICVLLLIEAGMSVCMQDVPIWLHGIVAIAQVVVGIIFGKTIFLLLCALFYVVGILALNVWNN